MTRGKDKRSTTKGQTLLLVTGVFSPGLEKLCRMNRRQVLAGAGSGCIGVLAGCSSLLGGDQSTEQKPQLEVFVANALGESVEVTVTATRGSTEFFSHSYSLAPGEGDQSESFVGTPTEVRVSIRSGQTVTRDFSVPASCDSPDINVTLEPDEVLVTNGCVA